MNSPEAFQIRLSHAGLNQRKKGDKYCGLTGARCGSLLFGQNVTRQERPMRGSSGETKPTPSAEM